MSCSTLQITKEENILLLANFGSLTIRPVKLNVESELT